ncbi:MAG TPA: hypothetical protein PKW33_02230 [Anaerolineaceae bacterium]|nr:hypothetical protein [Anaerolineaceae bacterium]HPN50378.1 hypothetical protein [Anaerolineaceae bacterium]
MRKLIPVLINTGLILGLIMLLASVPASAETMSPPSEEGANPAHITGASVFYLQEPQPAAEASPASSEGSLVPLPSEPERKPAPDENPPLEDPALVSPYSYYTVSGTTLRGRDNLSTLVYAGSGCSYAISTATDQVFNTPLQLPDGATIKYLRLYFYDNDPNAQLMGYLTYYQPGLNVYDYIYLATGVTATGGLGYMDSPEVTLTVDNSAYAYALIVRAGASGVKIKFCGMRVAYLPPRP